MDFARVGSGEGPGGPSEDRAVAAALGAVAVLGPMVMLWPADTPAVRFGYLALAAAPWGALVGEVARQAGGVRRWGLLGMAMALPMAAALAAARDVPALSTPWLSGGALCGLVSIGAGIGALCRRPGASWGVSAAWLFVLATLCAGAPTGWGLMTQVPPFGPALTARLLDLSPVGLVLESGGADWMRSPDIYDAAETSRIGPDLRLAWRGAVAVPVAVVVGWALLAAALRRGR